MKDLSNREIMAMSENDFEEIINNPEDLKRIGSDAGHVQIVLFHMLRKNLKAIDNFNKSSEKSSNMIKKLTWVIVLLMIVQIIIAAINYKLL
jgi:hypothetical protein